MAEKKVLLIGSNGFIGRNILEQLGNKYAFIAPSHRELDLLEEGQVHKYFSLHPVDVVIHAANVGGNQKEASRDDVLSYNLRIFFNLIKQNQFYKKLIYFGSGAEYGKQHAIVNVKEVDDNHDVPKDNYGFYKYICARYIDKAKLPIYNLRLFGIYGKYEDYQYRFISNAICRAIVGLPITIEQNVIFDYLYIDDFIRILTYFIENTPTYNIYNISTGNKYELYDIAKYIQKISKNDVSIKIKKGELGLEYTSNNDRLKKEIPSFRFTSIEQGISSLYCWYSENRDSFDKAKLASVKRKKIW